MAHYEITILVTKNDKVAVQNMDKYLASAKAKKVSKEDWGVKPLAYVIKKQREAKYFHYNVEINGDKIADLDKQLIHDENLLRHLIVKVKPVKKTTKKKLTKGKKK